MPRHSEIRLGGRGAVLVPTFHWTGHPLVSDRPLLLVYPAGPGLPLTPAAVGGDRLAGVLGRTRAVLPRLLANEQTTGSAARHVGISNATASEHPAALRGARGAVRTGYGPDRRSTSGFAALVDPPVTPPGKYFGQARNHRLCCHPTAALVVSFSFTQVAGTGVRGRAARAFRCRVGRWSGGGLPGRRSGLPGRNIRCRRVPGAARNE